MSKVVELFGEHTATKRDWRSLLRGQRCPFTETGCVKTRKSQPDIAIGTCSLEYGSGPVIICPNRLLERRQVFLDCLHLLGKREPGDELHIIPEVTVPGGSVDYFLAAARGGKIRDFVAIEFQSLDTTGTVWPERQRLLASWGVATSAADVASKKTFGMNWKMTAKTILVQLHHKVETLEHLGKKLVLVIQDRLLDYMRKEFNFAHLGAARQRDSLQIHAYGLTTDERGLHLELGQRTSTDAAGVAQALGLQITARVELETLLADLDRKASSDTVLQAAGPVPRPGRIPTR
jgi:hypothetical protein